MVYKTRVYVVEGDRSVALKLRRFLEEEGYHVVGISDNGDDAVRNILRILPDFILMDIHLKGKMDGLHAASAIMQKHIIPISFLVEDGDNELLEKAALEFHYGYIEKPYDPSQLRIKIERTLFPISQIQEEVAEETALAKKLDLLTHIDLFKNISTEDLTNFAKGTSIRSLDAGTFILTEEEEASTAGFIVISGKVSIMKSSVGGKELIVSLLGAGDIFGLFYLLKDFGSSCTARTQIDSRVLWVQKSAFEALKTKAPQFNVALTEALAMRLVISYELASGLAHSRVEDRIVTAILTLLPRLGQMSAKTAPSPKTTIPKKTPAIKGGGNSRLLMTRKELADLTGTTPETAIRITKNLEREGYLDLSRPGIIKIINLEGLQSMVDV